MSEMDSDNRVQAKWQKLALSSRDRDPEIPRRRVMQTLLRVGCLDGVPQVLRLRCGVKELVAEVSR